MGVALLEELQQLENSSREDDVTFNYTSKITRESSLTFTFTRTCCEPAFHTSPLRVGVAGPGEAPSPSGSVLALLESLQNAPHLEVHKDMISWILKVGAAEVVVLRTRTRFSWRRSRRSGCFSLTSALVSVGR